jgi:hypothetical protein
MSAEFLLKVADVLEQAAKVLDANEAEKTAAVKQARESAARAVAAKFAEVTGEDLPGDVLTKLASSDGDVLATVQKLLDKKAEESVESMGHSSDKAASQVPVTRKDRAQAAWDNFGSYINS